MPSQAINLVNDMEAYRDKFGVIVQPDGDGGDALNRAALFGFAKFMLLNIGYDLSNELNVIKAGLPNGRYRRHPDPTRWYYNENNVTRDQMGPTEAALALYSMRNFLAEKTMLEDHLKLRVKQFLFHFDTQNGGADMPPLIHKFPDPPSPEEIAVMIRGLGWWLLYPLLILLDISLAFSVNSDLQEGQAILNVAVANNRFKTPFGMLAKHMLKAKSTADAELRAYHSPARNGIVPLGELMILAKNAL